MRVGNQPSGSAVAIVTVKALVRPVLSTARLTMLRVEIAVKVIDILLRLVGGVAVPFLELADQNVLPAGDLLEVVIGELAPLDAHLPLDLRPVALQRILIHRSLLFMDRLRCSEGRRGTARRS